jgi:transcriptional regulator with XRE-family HTH domain
VVSEPSVTVLRDAHGAALHAILPWNEFEALMQAAKANRTDAATRSVALPPQVSSAVCDGAHPLRAWREYRNHNQAQLAALVGISRAYLAQIEGGERTGTLEVTARIARALNCSIDQLIRHVEDFAGMIAALAAMPSKVRDLVALVPPDAWRRKPGNGSFSLIEHICHLRDIDNDGYRIRVERMLTEEQPVLPDIDGDALAGERSYLSQDLEQALASFTMTRRQIAARLARLTPEQRGRTGLMAGTREITLEELVDAMMAHDSEHLDELSELHADLKLTL